MEGLLSIVLPAYNEEKVIEETVSVLTNILVKEKINYELVLVNDGSKDLTWTKIKIVAMLTYMLQVYVFHGILARRQPYMLGWSRHLEMW